MLCCVVKQSPNYKQCAPGLSPIKNCLQSNKTRVAVRLYWKYKNVIIINTNNKILLILGKSANFYLYGGPEEEA